MQKVTPMSQQTWEFLASQTRWEPWEDSQSAAFPHPNQGSDPWAQRGEVKKHPRTVQAGAGGANKTSPPWEDWIWNWTWQVKNQQGTCETAQQPGQEPAASREPWQSQSQPQRAGGTAAQTNQRCCSACKTESKKAQGSWWHVQRKSLRLYTRKESLHHALLLLQGHQHRPWLFCAAFTVEGLLHDRNGGGNKYNLVQSQT